MGECNEIGARIKYLRQKRHMTQSELANKLFTSRETVNMWERGVRDIKTGSLIALAEVLNTTCDYLLRGIETGNINASKDLGLSNQTITHLRFLREAAEKGEWMEADELQAIDFLIGSDYGSIVEEIYDFLTTDFGRPFILSDSHAEQIDDAFSENDKSAVAFRQQHRNSKYTPTNDMCFLEIDADVYENAFLAKITARLKMIKYFNGTIPTSIPKQAGG